MPKKQFDGTTFTVLNPRNSHIKEAISLIEEHGGQVNIVANVHEMEDGDSALWRT